MICYGPHASDIVGRHLIIVVALGIVPSWIIGDLVYWKKNRYLKYFAAFEKEGRKSGPRGIVRGGQMPLPNQRQ